MTTLLLSVENGVTAAARARTACKWRAYNHLKSLTSSTGALAIFTGAPGTTLALSSSNRARLAVLASRQKPSKAPSHNGGRRT